MQANADQTIASAVDLSTCDVVDDIGGRIATAYAHTAVATGDQATCTLIGDSTASQQLHTVALRSTLDGGAIDIADIR